MLRCLCIATLAVATLTAQAPNFEASKVQIPNSNDTTPLGPGELISVYGADLGPDQPCQGQADPDLRETPDPQWRDPRWINLMVFPKELCGVRVMVGGEPAGLLYVHRDQINFKVPQSVPMEGTVGLQIIHGDQASTVVQIEAGLAPLRLILPEPAFTGMPIWVGVVIPRNRASPIRYPYPLGPADIGCNELLVRKDGRLLERNPFVPYMGHVLAGPICGSSSLGDRYQNRLPLHRLYRIEEPGDYEIRLSMGHAFASGRVLTEEEIAVRSEWTPLRVEAATEHQRREWLDELTNSPPVSPEELIADYLPSILGVPDEQSLAAVVAQLYHLHPRVAQYSAQAFGYWPKPQIAQLLQRAVEQQGPSQAAVRWLSMMREAGTDPVVVVEASLPYLLSSDPVRLRGALQAVRGIRGLDDSQPRAELTARAATILLEAERTVVASGDPESQQHYAELLGYGQDVRAAPILWRFVDEGIALSSALRSLAMIARLEDLPRLAAFLFVPNMHHDYYVAVSSLPWELSEFYGTDSFGYLKRLIQETDNRRLRRSAAEGLVAADHPAAWAFIAVALETNAPYKAALMQHLVSRYREASESEAAMLALAKRLAAGLKL
ncbi:MAG: hypothetical protein O3A53_12830 [Acidobacteria bacterium]|nr:hypothetical protein [Acidobacteriota bacterium]MDA1235676.1 hypothetical protein [Acidobacteriota bacterium]